MRWFLKGQGQQCKKGKPKNSVLSNGKKTWSSNTKRTLMWLIRLTKHLLRIIIAKKQLLRPKRKVFGLTDRWIDRHSGLLKMWWLDVSTNRQTDRPPDRDWLTQRFLETATNKYKIKKRIHDHFKGHSNGGLDTRRWLQRRISFSVAVVFFYFPFKLRTRKRKKKLCPSVGPSIPWKWSNQNVRFR